jgi:putative phosphoribosyl transferase
MKNRSEVGDLLAAQLAGYANKPDVIVLALPRGGVAIGVQVAQRLNAPLDVFLVRKLGVPTRPSLPMGVLTTGEIRILDGPIIDALAVDEEVIQEVTTAQQGELARLEHCYRGDRPPATIAGKTVIVVTDSVTTGGTVEAAIAALRRLRAARIVVAAPTIARPEHNRLGTVADSVVAVIIPEEFYGGRQWHQDFSKTSDAEVYELLAEANGWVTEVAA